MIPSIRNYCDELIKNFNFISPERKIILKKISNYISDKKKENKQVNLIYICTHNARRSHFGHAWALTAINYFNLKNINAFSGGTETTAFHPNAVNALRRIGFIIEPTLNDKNPVYEITYNQNSQPWKFFSKEFDHLENPQKDFAAILVCSDAEQNCPFVPGTDIRVLTSYNDPKDFDNTPEQDKNYDERCKQIALEVFYVFSKV